MNFISRRRDPGLNRTVVMVSKEVNGVWTKPEPETALLPEKFTFEPFVTPDNKRLYFQTAGVVRRKNLNDDKVC